MGPAANKPLCQRFNVQYYPTINLFLAAENTEVRWSKDDTISADALHAWIVKQSQPAASVEKLTTANFEETVMGSDEVRFLAEILDDFRRFVDEIWRF